jgi:hypothetical protein
VFFIISLFSSGKKNRFWICYGAWSIPRAFWIESLGFDTKVGASKIQENWAL